MAWTPYYGPGASPKVTQSTRSEGFSPLGFLGNALGDVGDIVTGLTGIVSNIGGDVVHTVGSALGGHLPTHLNTVDMLSNLPGALLNDYATRYNPKNLLTGLYHDPLYYLLDAAALSSGAVTAAEKGLIGGKLGEALIPGETKVLQNPTINQLAPEVHSIVDARNPIKRFVINEFRNNKFRNSYLPIENIEQEVEKLRVRAQDGSISVTDQARLGRLENAAKRARDEGALVFASPKFGEKLAKREINKMRGGFIGKLSFSRNQLSSELWSKDGSGILNPLGSYGSEEMEAITPAMMGVTDADLHKWSPEHFQQELGKAGFQDLGDAQMAVIGGTDPRLATLPQDIHAAVRKTVADPLQGTAIRDVGGKPLRVFHGTGNVFDQFDLSLASEGDLFGPGIYTTDNPTIASTYSVGGGSNSPWAYKSAMEGRLRSEPVFFAKTPEEAIQQIKQAHPNASIVDSAPLSGPSGGFSVQYLDAKAPNVRPFYLNIRNPFMVDEPWTAETKNALAEGARAVGAEGLASQLDKMAVRATRPGTDLYDAIVSFFNGDKGLANEVLQRAGFDGIEYAGGARMGETVDHRAFVAFSPDQVVPYLDSTPNLGYERWKRPLPVPNLSVPLAGRQVVPDPQAAYAAGQQALPGFRNDLRELYPRSVEASRKPLDRLTEKIESTGYANDVVRARITLADWKDLDRETGKLGSKFQVVGIEDLRSLPDDNGARGVTATVQLQDGTLAEVEFGTKRYAKARDASTVSNHWIERSVDERNRLASITEFPDEATAARTASRIANLDRQIRYMKMGVRGLWEGVSNEIAKDFGGAVPGGIKRQVLDDLRVWVWKNHTGPMIDAGVFDPAAAFERAYLPLRMENGAVWDRHGGDDGMGDFVGGPSAEELHMKRQAEDLPTPIYFPFYDTERARPFDFLSKRNLNGGLKQVQNPGYMKHASGKLYMDDTYIKNPADALLRRATAALRLRDNVDLYKWVLNTYGRKLAEGERLMEGETVTHPMGYLNFFSTKIGMTDELLAKMIETAGLSDDQVAAILESGLADNTKRMIGATKNGVERYAIPEFVQKQFEAHVIAPMFENGFRVFWDSGNKLWRSMVLTARPAWVANNIFGSAIFTKMQGGSIIRVMRQATRNWRTAMADIIPEEVAKEVQTGLFASEGPEAMQHLGTAAGTRTGQVLDWASGEWRSRRGFRTIHKAGVSMRHFNQEVENAFRRESFLTAVEKQRGITMTKGVLSRFRTSYDDLKKIAEGGITPEEAKRALDEVNYFHNDYGSLSPFERNIVRRFIMPFYSFYKHIATLAVRYPFDYPGRSLILTKTAQLDNEIKADQYGAMPPWLRGGAPIGPYDPNGSSFFLGSAINPFSTLSSISDFGTHGATSFLSLTYPWPKLLYEQGTGESTLTGRDLTDPNVVAPFGLGQQYRQLSDGTMVPVEVTAPGIGEALLQQFPLYNVARQIAAGGQPYDTSGLAQIVAGRLTGQDQRMLTSSGEALPVNILDALGGYLLSIRGHPYSLQDFQQQRAEDAASAARLIAKRNPAALGGGGGSASPQLTPQSTGGWTPYYR